MKRSHAIAVAVSWLVILAQAGTELNAAPETGSAADKPAGPSPAQGLAIAEKLAPSLVRVEYTLQFDKGEAPTATGWAERCPNCGAYHRMGNLEQAVQQERPVEVAGVLVSASEVVTRDAMIHPRFIKQLVVRHRDQAVKADIAAYCKQHNAVILKLAEPLAKAKPVEFKPEARSPYLAVSYSESDGAWAVTVASCPMSPVTTGETGRRFIPAPTHVVIVSEDGTPVGLTMNGEFPTDDSWKGSPLNWTMITQEQMTNALAALAGKADQGLLHVRLNFRSPKKTEATRFSMRSDEGSATEQDVLGLLVEPAKILVLAPLEAKTTARLERITIHLPDGQKVPARFSQTLTDYGCLVAVTDKPLPGPVVFAARSIDSYRMQMLLSAEVRLQGSQRVVYYCRHRIPALTKGHKQRLFPESRGEADNLFLFDEDGTLVAFPVNRRPKVALRERYSYSRDSTTITPAGHITEVLTDLARNTDPNNVPLTEHQENRLAWLGVELQPLDKELARANKVSDQTRDGEIGALVSYVYPGSPAAKQDIQPGFILIRLHVPDQPKPVDIQLDRYEFRASQFPWDRLDEMPERYFDQVPRPWTSVENAFTRALTDLGFGKPFKAEFFNDGKTLTRDFTVEESPAHFDSAARYAAKDLGVTCRDLTYEVRRYFQKKPDDPGVIISKLEPGSRGSVAGLRPFEIITHINDQPVKDVREFEKLVTAAKGELRLTVKRMARGRIVKIDLAAAHKPTTQPADDSDE